MPQMAPLNWTLLFLFFTLIFITFNSMIYFNFLTPWKKDKIKKYSLKYNWKW